MEASEQSGALKDRAVGKRAPDRAPSLSEGWGSWGAGLTAAQWWVCQHGCCCGTGCRGADLGAGPGSGPLTFTGGWGQHLVSRVIPLLWASSALQEMARGAWAGGTWSWVKGVGATPRLRLETHHALSSLPQDLQQLCSAKSDCWGRRLLPL